MQTPPRAAPGVSARRNENLEVIREADAAGRHRQRRRRRRSGRERGTRSAARAGRTPRGERRTSRRTPGICGGSSAVTRPSEIASSPPSIHASMPRPPPMAARMSGIVMNGPIPTMSIMFSAMPRHRPMSRRRVVDTTRECDTKPRLQAMSARVPPPVSTETEVG